MCSAKDDFKLVEKRVLEFRSHICRVIIAPNVLLWMPNFIAGEDEREIKTLHKKSPGKASFLFIEKILKCTHFGKWEAFIEALTKAEYPYLVSLLKSNDKDPEQCTHQKKILQIFAPYLELQLEPCDLIMHLNASELINERDMEEINACQRSRGCVAATILMLDRIQRRQAPSRWYTVFLKILYQKGFKEIVLEMEPEFTLDCEILKSPKIYMTDNSDSENEVDEYGCTVEEKIETKVRYFQSEITQVVNVEKIAVSLCQLVGIEKVLQIMQISHTSQKESIECILEAIGKLKSKTKWRSFISCLKESDYPHLADLLSRTRTSKLQCKERDLLRLFHSTLGEQLEPADLVTHLEKNSVINHQDKEEISNALQLSGKTAASLVLIDCLQCRLAPGQWFSAFLDALTACGRKDIVQKIYPEHFETSMDQSDTIKENVFTEDTSAEDSKFADRMESAYCHVYKLEKAAKLQLDKIQNHFNDMKRNLTAKIENKTVSLLKTLEHVDALTGREPVDDIKQEMEKSLRQVLTSCYTFNAVDAFLNLDELGVLQESTHDSSTMFSGSVKTRPKHRVINVRKRCLSTGSSSSGSSGYLIVENGSFSSSSSSFSVHEGHKTKAASKVTFAESKEIEHENRDNKSMKKDPTRLLPQNSKPILNKDYLSIYSERKTCPGRRRTVSESSIMSTDGSFNSSFDRPSSSFTDALTDTSTMSSTTKTTSVSEKKAMVERTESYLYHHSFLITCKPKCQFSSLCVLPNNKTILVDQGNGCIYIYDDASKKVVHRLNHLIPICVCNVGDSCLFILFRRRDCTNILMQFHIKYSTTSDPKRIVTGITFVKEVQVSKCDGKLCSVASSSNKVVALCSNKHVHFISSDGHGTEIVFCDIEENEWWPSYSVFDSECKFTFVYDIYSRSVYCFCISTGEMKWNTKLYHVEGMTLCGESIYLSVNVDNKIEVLSKYTGKQERVITENVRRPLAVSSSPGHDTIIVTQYHPKGNKINRTVNYF